MALLPETEDLIAVFATPPSDERKALIDDTIRALLKGPSPTLWDKLDAFYVLAAHEPEAACRNWKSPGTPGSPGTDGSYKLAPQNGPTFIPDVGYQGDGVDAYLDTHIVSNDAIFSTSSAVMGIGVQNNPSSGAGQYLIGQEFVSNERFVLFQNKTDGELVGRLMSGAGANLGVAPKEAVHLTVSRIDGDKMYRYIDGASALEVNSGMPGVSTNNITLLRRGTLYSDATISFAYFGKGLSAEEVKKLDLILRTYLARLQIPDLPYATPEQFWAVADAHLDENGNLVGRYDTGALNACRDYCVTTGKTMLLTSAYRHEGAFLLDKPITIRGADRTNCGIYLDITPEVEGISIQGQHITCENFFIDVFSDEDIQNGQGNYATCITIGNIYYPLSLEAAPDPGESDREFALRVSPPLASDIVLRDLWLRRRFLSGGGHAIAAVGRTSGVTIENIVCEGYDAKQSMGSFLLAHWGMSGLDFPKHERDYIRPFVLRKNPYAFSYHPNNIYVRNVRLRNTGRLFEHSASYNIHIDGVDMDGFDDGWRVNGVQIVNMTTGDEADSFAHPDDKGKVYSNIVVGNVVAWNIEGGSPNAAGTSLLDWPAASTSKYYNADKDPSTGKYTRTKDCMYFENDYEPVDLTALNGYEHEESFSVPEAKIGMTPFVWYSEDIPPNYTMTASIEQEGEIKVTFAKLPAALDLAKGTIVVHVEKHRRQYQPEYTGCHFYNWRIHGIGTTTDLFNFRNGRIFASFDNIHALGHGTVDGARIVQMHGSLNFRNCVLPGKVELSDCDGVSFDNCAIRDTATVQLETTLATALQREHVLTGTPLPTADDSAVVGTITEARSHVLAFNSQSGSFAVNHTITGQTSGATAKIASQDDNGSSGTLTLSDVSGAFQHGEFIEDSSNTAIVDANASTSTFFVRLQDTSWRPFQKDKTVSSNTLAFDEQIANFGIGQLLKGKDSGATGIITAQVDNMATGVLTLSLIDGKFNDNEEIESETGKAKVNGTTDVTVKAVSPVLSQAVLIDGEVETSYLLKDVSLGETRLALCSQLAFVGQTTNFTVNDTVSGADGSGVVVAQTDNLATGTLYLKDVSGSFAEDEEITGILGGKAFVQAVRVGGEDVTIVHGFPNDLSIGDKITFPGGTTYVAEYQDTTGTDVITVKPLPAAASAGDPVQLHRVSRNISFNNCEIVGAGRGVDVSNSRGVSIKGGTIRDCGQYGLMVNKGAIVDVEGVTFSNNGLWSVELQDAGSFLTTDIFVGPDGTLRADKLIFEDGNWSDYNVLVDSEAIGGHLRDSIFVPVNAAGDPLTAHILASSKQFLFSGNRDTEGTPVLQAGTWLPELQIAGSSTGITYATRSGTYTVLEDRVSIDWDITLASKGSTSGSITIVGLPFSQDTSGSQSVGTTVLSGATGLTGAPSCRVTSGVIGYNQFSATGLATLTQASLVNETAGPPFVAGTRLRGSATYRRAA